jgi:hypothetical protein
MKIIHYLILTLLFASCKNPEDHQVVNDVTSIDRVQEKSTDDLNRVIKQNEVAITDTLTKTSTPFFINEIQCYWKLTVYLDHKTQGGSGSLNLISLENDDVLLTDGLDEYYELHAPYYTHSFNGISFEQLNEDSITDLDFDGNQDLMLFSRTGSGSGGDFYKVYLFNEMKPSFELSEEFSGGNINVNKASKSLASSW